MREIINILMRRDQMDYESAKELVEHTRDEILNCNGDYGEAVQIIEDNLGLEPDYLVFLL